MQIRRRFEHVSHLGAIEAPVGLGSRRLDSRTAEPQYLRDVETARARLQQTCVGGR